MGSGRTVETLDRTGGFGVDVVRRRLLETTQHTLNVTRDLESVQPGGDGFADSVRVRLLHASVRRRVMRMAEEAGPAYYDTRRFGVPINDLDCVGTISTFSAALVWMGLPRQGIWLRNQEIADYLALWRYVAYLMGAPHAWMATPASARRMMESLLVAEIRPSRASQNLANNILAGLQGQPPTYASREFLCAQARWLNGGELAQALAVPRPSPFYFALVAGQCLLFMTISYVNRSVGYLDERNIKVSERGTASSPSFAPVSRDGGCVFFLSSSSSHGGSTSTPTIRKLVKFSGKRRSTLQGTGTNSSLWREDDRSWLFCTHSSHGAGARA